MLGSQDLMIALAIGLIFFGSKKLPELARGLGQSLKEFKKATSEAAETPAPAGSAAPAVATPPAQACGACHRPLEPGWSHCPACGARTSTSG
jgi:sec-independent protein translocase protein TatA